MIAIPSTVPSSVVTAGQNLSATDPTRPTFIAVNGNALINAVPTGTIDTTPTEVIAYVARPSVSGINRLMQFFLGRGFLNVGPFTIVANALLDQVSTLTQLVDAQPVLSRTVYYLVYGVDFAGNASPPTIALAFCGGSGA